MGGVEGGHSPSMNVLSSSPEGAGTRTSSRATRIPPVGFAHEPDARTLDAVAFQGGGGVGLETGIDVRDSLRSMASWCMTLVTM